MRKILADILYKCPVREVIGTVEQAVTGIAFDSRMTKPDHAFVAIKGTQTDGHKFIEQAIANGANAVICEEIPKNRTPGTTYIKVRSSAYSLGIIASNFFDIPSSKIKLIGITGTNGKTTIATLLYRLFRQSGFQAGLISTIENRIGKKVSGTTHTTPDPVVINNLLHQMVENRCTHAFMEVSSHALVQHRVSGITFSGGIFTNLTHDHLDYHKTFDAYRDAKKILFDMLPKSAFALINRDDRNAQFMVQNTRAKVQTFALQHHADFKGKLIENQFEGLLMDVDGQQVYTRLTGAFNASNLLAIYAAACLIGMDKIHALTGLSMLKPAAGRFEYERSAEGIVGIVDYAHTPDALENVLKTINEIRSHNEQLITVIGAGGNRDRSKRPKMAEVASEMSDRLILTSDNPRMEDPTDIINEMRTGVPPQHYKKTLAITDRREAIRTAFALSRPGDIILVAGKGHEKYQEIKGVRYPFDDKKELFNLLKPTQA